MERALGKAVVLGGVVVALGLGATAALVVACSSSDDDGGGGKTDAAAAKDSSVTSPPSDASVADASPSADSASPADAAVDATPADAGRVYSTDRSTFFGDSRCSATGALFCDGFEEAALDAGDWSLSSYGGGTPVTLSTAQAARGTGSIHVMLTGSGSSHLTLKKIFPVPADLYFGRVFVRFHQLPRPPMTYSHWTFAAGSGTGAAGETRLSSQYHPGEGNLFSVGTDTGDEDGGTGDWTNDDKDPGPDSGADGGVEAIPVDQWICVEWMNDGGNDLTRFWWDGVEHPSLSTSKTVHGIDGKIPDDKDLPYILPMYNQAWIGFDEYSDAGQTGADKITFEAWLDEIAYDTQRIGCSN
jgi:hypothetical protein